MGYVYDEIKLLYFVPVVPDEEIINSMHSFLFRVIPNRLEKRIQKEIINKELLMHLGT